MDRKTKQGERGRAFSFGCIHVGVVGDVVANMDATMDIMYIMYFILFLSSEVVTTVSECTLLGLGFP